MANSSAVVPGTNGTALQVNNIRKDLMLGARLNQAVAGATNVTLDFSNVENGNIKTISVDQNITVAFSGLSVYPTLFFVRFVNDASGGHTITLPGGIKFPGGSAPNIATGANEVTGFMFICTASGAYDCYYAGFGLKEPA